MAPQSFDFFFGAAGHPVWATDQKNVRAFEHWELRPRVMRDTSEISLAVELLGHRVSMPILIAPTGNQRRGASRRRAWPPLRHRTSATRSWSSATTRARRSRRSGRQTPGPLWMQIYPMKDPAYDENFVGRAVDAGYSAIMVTVDNLGQSTRERGGLDRAPESEIMGLANYRDTDLVMHSLARVQGDAEDRDVVGLRRLAEVVDRPSDHRQGDPDSRGRGPLHRGGRGRGQRVEPRRPCARRCPGNHRCAARSRPRGGRTRSGAVRRRHALGRRCAQGARAWRECRHARASRVLGPGRRRASRRQGRARGIRFELAQCMAFCGQSDVSSLTPDLVIRATSRDTKPADQDRQWVTTGWSPRRSIVAM